MSYATLVGSFILIAATPLVAMAQEGAVDPGTTGPAWSPYLVGALIGLLCMLTFYFSGHALGASTAYARLAGMVGKLFGREHTESLEFYQKKEPKVDWELMLVGGVIAGALLAAGTGGELTFRWLPPMWQERFGDAIWLRLAVAFAGGGLMAYGARLAGGCTSGHGISGALQLSVSSWVALISFFVGGVATAAMMYWPLFLN